MTAPIDMQVFEGKVLLGSTEDGRVKLHAGPNAGDRRHTVVDVNAVPWANIAIGGQSLGNIPVSVGSART